MLIYPNALQKLQTDPKYQPYLQLVRDMLPYLHTVRFGRWRWNDQEIVFPVKPVCVFWQGPDSPQGTMHIGWRKCGVPGFGWGSEAHAHTNSMEITRLRRVLTMKKIPLWVNAEPHP